MGDNGSNLDNLKSPYQLHLEAVQRALAEQKNFKKAEGGMEAYAEHKQRMANLHKDLALEEAKYRTGRQARVNARIAKFSEEVKFHLLAEALGYNFDRIGKIEQFTEHQTNIGHSMIEKLIKDEGVDDLLYKFNEKNVYLSEYAQIIDEFHNGIMESCKKKCKEVCDDTDEEEYDTCFELDKDYADGFMNAIVGATPDRMANAINKRVEDSVTKFVDQNTEDKLAIKGIYNKAKAKIDATKNAALKEEYQLDAKAAVSRIYNHPTGLYGMMVREASESIIKDENLKKSFALEGGKINMGRIMNDTRIMYTVLEMANSMGVIDVDRDYVRGILDSFKK